MKALVIGGTGPTGPGVVRGLLDMGYEVTIYHRGYHETDQVPTDHIHLHGDPDNSEELTKDLTGTYWDVVCAMYGRHGGSQNVFAGRCDRFIYIGGQGGRVRPNLLPFPQGRAQPIREDFPGYKGEPPAGSEYSYLVARSEREVIEHSARGDYAGTVFRYAILYGPRAPRHTFWTIVRRILDGRRQLIVPGDGSQLRPYCYSDNAVRQILLSIPRREAHGEVFNSVDQDCYFLRDIIRIIADELNAAVDVVGITHPMVQDLTDSYVRDVNWLWDAAKLTYLLGYTDLVEPAEAIRGTVRWQVENRGEIDEEQLAQIVPDPFAYELEDRLIASHRAWQDEAARSIPRPEVKKALGDFRAVHPGQAAH